MCEPAGLAPAKPGDHFQAEFDPEEDAIALRRIAKDADWLGVLKRCPVKNVSVAHVWAEQQHQLQTAGQPMPVEDGYIAAIARRHNLIIATGNVKDFQRPGIKVFNPFEAD